jgi:hypothetical protein
VTDEGPNTIGNFILIGPGLMSDSDQDFRRGPTTLAMFPLRLTHHFVLMGAVFMARHTLMIDLTAV